ncbi:hypothetical protein [Actinophytocola oryzae]|uniref:Lipoprotein n=1 Tax=Actinophytocola oryzae TaxID=502181 RepID=A0A4R7VAT7_9PSEU|nr:hypothetical protein [Actinophytocola oryzae]TDV46114.1 hypothetical protein CLV71_11172 [Actinophytocola oryzae]
MIRIHTALLVVCATALVACAGLAVPLLGSAEPASCRSCPVADPAALPSPAPLPKQAREPGVDHCLVGSWRTVEETVPVKFYADVDPFLFTTSGRYYEFRPDGTGIERNDDITFVGSHRGNETRLVADGWREFTWTGTADTLTFVAITNAALTWSYYDQRGLVSSQPEPLDPRRNEVKHYACAGTRLVETGDNGYRSTWDRTTDFGVYG